MRRPAGGTSLAFLAAPALRAGRRHPGGLRAFVGGFMLASVLGLILWCGQ